MSSSSEEKILGYVSNVSPVKKSGPRKFFNFNIHTKEGTRRGVCFSPEKRNPMSAYQDDQKPIKVHKFRISSTNDIMFDQKTIISPTVLDTDDAFKPNLVPSDSLTTLSSINKAMPEQFVTIKALVHTLRAPKTISTKRNQTLLKQEGIIADPNDQIKIVLWEDQVDSITEGKTYLFKNIIVKENNNKERYVNPPKSVAELNTPYKRSSPLKRK